VIFGDQLIATKLNIANGSDAAPILTSLKHARRSAPSILQ
jgi:hypothetical protein